MKRILGLIISLMLGTIMLVGCGQEKTNTTTQTAKQEAKQETATKQEVKKQDNTPEEYKVALKKAEGYSRTAYMSKVGIYRQLTSEVEKFPAEAAKYATDNLKVDYNQNALKKAESYRETASMSKEAIRNQLTSEVEGFTAEEAEFAVSNLK